MERSNDYKSKCALCNCFFEKKSISYRISNYRMIELWRSWNFIREGKRYESPSFKYANSFVCRFCTQFFAFQGEEDGESKKTALSLHEANDAIGSIVAPSSSLNVSETMPLGWAKESILRRNIAIGCTAIQSSTVDGAEASIALEESITASTDVLSEYTAIKFSKTRREMNPYWEVNFGKCRNLRAVKLSLSADYAKDVSVSIFILKEALGESKLSLESLQSIAVDFNTIKLLDFKCTDKKSASGKKLLLYSFQDVFWTLPSTGSGAAVRVVLHGKYSLKLYAFEAYQGDTFVDRENKESSPPPMRRAADKKAGERLENEEKEDEWGHNGKDAIFSVSPFPLVEEDLNAFSWSLDTTTRKVRHFVLKLQDKMDVRYDVVELWAKHLSAALLFFEPLELRALLRAVFNPVILESEGSAKRWEHEGNAILQESNCFEEKSLTSAYPRIPLSRLLNRLKTVLRWIQMEDESRLSLLGCLLSSAKMQRLAYSYKEALSTLGWQFKVAESYCTTHAKEARYEGLASCCWAQFIVLMHLTSIRQIECICAEVFFLPQTFITGCLGKLSQVEMEESVANDEGDAMSISRPSTMQKPSGHNAPSSSSQSSLPHLRTIPPREHLSSSSTKATPLARKSRELGSVKMKFQAAPPSAAYNDSAAKESSVFRGFKKFCGMCYFKFPKDSCNYSVLFKQIVALRRHWDPSLVAEEVLALDNTACFMNEIAICAFCYQFFDPTTAVNVDSGAAAHLLEYRMSTTFLTLQESADSIAAKIMEPALPFKAFYDDRY